MKSLLSIGEAARRLGLSVDTVREMERNGELSAVRTPGGHRRFKPAVLDAYLARRSGSNTGRQRAPTITPRAPSQAQAERRTRARAFDDELPDESSAEAWDDPESFEPRPPGPAAPAAKPLHEQLIEQLTRTTERLAEETRLGGLKSYGRSLIPFDASAAARSAVLEAMAVYVTAARFPASVPLWEARQAIEAKVAAILEPFNAAAVRKAEADTRKAEQERDDQRVESLIERGRSRALFKTLRWDNRDARDARAEAQEAPEDEVEADWSERDVDELVDEVLEEWDEDSDE